MQDTAGTINIPKDVLKKDTGFDEVFSTKPTVTGRRANRRTIKYREVSNKMVPSGDYAIAPNGSLRRLDKLKAQLDKQLKDKK